LNDGRKVLFRRVSSLKSGSHPAFAEACFSEALYLAGSVGTRQLPAIFGHRTKRKKADVSYRRSKVLTLNFAGFASSSGEDRLAMMSALADSAR